MLDSIVNEMIIASAELKTNSVSRIAESLGYQPILIMNALSVGEKAGKFTYIRKKDLINISEDVEVDALTITEGLADSRAQIEFFITEQNALGTDLTTDELRHFIPMLPEFHFRLAIRTSKVLATYQLTDPKDKQSVYTFVTLKENVDKQFGKKQFNVTKAKKSKSIKE